MLIDHKKEQEAKRRQFGYGCDYCGDEEPHFLHEFSTNDKIQDKSYSQICIFCLRKASDEMFSRDEHRQNYPEQYDIVGNRIFSKLEILDQLKHYPELVEMICQD